MPDPICTLDQALNWIVTRNHDQLDSVEETLDGLGSYYEDQLTAAWLRTDTENSSEEHQSKSKGATATTLLSRVIADGVVSLTGIYPCEQTQDLIEQQKLTVNRIVPTLNNGPQLQVPVATSLGWTWLSIAHVRISIQDLEKAFPPFLVSKQLRENTVSPAAKSAASTHGRPKGRRPVVDWERDIRPIVFELMDYHADIVPHDPEWNSMNACVRAVIKKYDQAKGIPLNKQTARRHISKFIREWRSDRRSPLAAQNEQI